jgi:lysophospholipase L1-like esterase
VRDVLPLRPKAVTLYFGWNDHWIGFGVEDDQIETAWGGSTLGSLRLMQLLRRARIGWLALAQTASPLRVPPDDFRSNLREMVRASEAAGTVPVLLTAPASHERGAEPRKLRERHLPELEQLVALHRSYAAIVREVAEAEPAVLCDLEARYVEMPPEQRREDFLRDGIHLNPSGSARVAELLADCFEAEQSLWTLWR